MQTATLEWQGNEYILLYEFGIIRRMRDDGINMVKIYRSVTADPESTMGFGDDIARVIAWLLNAAGASTEDSETAKSRTVTAEDVWRWMISDNAILKQALALFMWICGCHFASSPMAPKAEHAKKPARKTTTRRK